MLQVIYQYASIVTGVKIDYPEPARTIIRVISVFSMQFLNYAPPECVNEGATFYDKLLIMTIFQILVPPVIAVYFGRIKQDASWKQKTLVATLLFFEFFLSATTTVIFKSLDCITYAGEEFLKVELTIACDSGSNPARMAWVVYAWIMVFVYPIGVPLLQFILLWRMRKPIQNVMAQVKERTEATGNPCSAAEFIDENDDTTRLVRASACLFEKYDPESWWFGVLAIYIRLLETSLLVFFESRMMQSFFATCMGLISIFVLRVVQPWLNPRDDQVAEAGQWLVYVWMFALLAYPGWWAWGLPLTSLTIAFLAFTVIRAREDIVGAQPAAERVLASITLAPDVMLQLPGFKARAGGDGAIVLALLRGNVRSRFVPIHARTDHPFVLRSGRGGRAAGGVSGRAGTTDDDRHD